MAGPVERAGLQYTIQVRDQFTQPLRDGRKQVDLFRQSFHVLKDDMRRGRAEASKFRREMQALKSINASTNRGGTKRDVRDSQRRIKTIQAEIRARKELLQAERSQRRATQAAQRAEQQASRRSREHAENTKRVVRALKQETLATKKSGDAILRNNRLKGAAIKLSRARAAALIREAEALGQVAIREQQRAQLSASRAVRPGGPLDPAALTALDARMKQIGERAQTIRSRFRRVGSAAGKGGQRVGFLADQFDRAGRSATTASLGIKRFLGAFAGIYLVTRLVRELGDAIKAGTDFNSKIENSVLGIQSILVATGKVYNAQGKLVEGAEAFAVAQAIAKKQVQQLRLEGLQTAATFDELLIAYQNALAPGLTAGLTTEQIRKFAVDISKAAGAIDLPQNQLAEEIRSILSGNINPRNTRIAVALGIKPEDIARAKEAGELADFLVEKFKAFDEAGVLALQNYTVIVSNLKNAFSQILGQGTSELFKDVKADLQGITSSLATARGDSLIVRPEAVAIVRQVAEGIRAALREGERLASTLSLDDAFKAADALGTSIGFMAQTLGAAAEGFAQGLKDAQSIAAGVVDKLTSLVGSQQDYQTLLSTVTRILTVSLALRVAWRGLVLPLTLAVAAVKIFFKTFVSGFPLVAGIVKLLKKIPVIGALISAPFVALFGVIGLIVAAIKSDFIRSIDIGGKKIGTWVDLFGSVLVTVIKRSGNFFASVWAKVVAGARILWSSFVNGLYDAILYVVEKALQVAALVSDSAEEKLKEIKAKREALGKDTDEAHRKELEQLAKKERALEKQLALEKARHDQRLREIEDAEKDGPRLSVAEAFSKGTDELLEAVGLVNKEASGLEDATKEVQAEMDAAAEAADDFEGVIAAANQTLKETSERLRDIQKEARKAQDELFFSRGARGLSGAARAIAKARFDALLAERKATAELDKAQQTAQATMNGLLEREKRLREQIAEIARQALNDRDAGDSLPEEQRGALERLRTQRSLIESEIRSLESEAIISGTSQEGTLDRVLKLSEQRERIEQQITSILQEANQSRGNARDLENELKELGIKRKVLAGDLAAIDQEAAAARDAILQRESAVIARIAEEEAEKVRRASATAAIQVESERERLAILSEQAHTKEAQIEQERELAQVNLDAARAMRQLREEELRAEYQALEASLATARSDEERAAIMELLVAKAEAISLALADADLEIVELAQKLQQIGAEKPELSFADAFAKALNDFGAERGRAESIGSDLGRAVGQGLEGFLSDSLISIFDPNANQSLGESINRLGSYLFGIIADAVSKALVGKLVASLGLGFADGGGVPAVGRAEGGDIPQVRGHGLRRPAGLDSRDTVPIWAQAGEFMVRKAIADKVRPFLHALNEGLIDPAYIESIASIGRRQASIARMGMGYAEGGTITRRVQAGDQVNVRPIVKIINVRSADEARRELMTTEGQEAVVNIMSNQADEVRSRRRIS